MAITQQVKAQSMITHDILSPPSADISATFSDYEEALLRPDAIPVSRQNWPDGVTPLVSICCLTYNQSGYVRSCLDGFLAQVTNFPVEIIIHDDASTDDTANIIREYQKEFPGIFFPLFQVENQYSRNVRVNAVYNIPRARGKYIAFCEGDDFWHAPNKLQSQVDYMELHPDHSACFHNVLEFHESSGESKPMINVTSKATYGLKDIVVENRVPMVSVMFRARLFQTFPDWYHRMPIGDWPLHVLNAEHGDIGYLDKVLATYRIHNGGVWSSLTEIETCRNNITVALAINKHFDNRFSDSIYSKITYWNYRIAINLLNEGVRNGVLSHLVWALRYKHADVARMDVFRLLVKVIAPGIYWRWERFVNREQRR